MIDCQSFSTVVLVPQFWLLPEIFWVFQKRGGIVMSASRSSNRLTAEFARSKVKDFCDIDKTCTQR